MENGDTRYARPLRFTRVLTVVATAGLLFTIGSTPGAHAHSGSTAPSVPEIPGAPRYMPESLTPRDHSAPGPTRPESARHDPLGGVSSSHERRDDPQHRDNTSAEYVEQQYQLQGIASWYGGKFQGRLTANGETFDTNELTAAHRELPFNTIVRVTNSNNGKSVVVRINDRGPFVDNRVIDLSRAAADLIDMTGSGIAPVRLEIMHYEPESDLRTLQIGSYTSRTTAETVVGNVRETGVKATIENPAGTNIFRVIITDVPESEIPEYRNRLAAVGHESVLVRRE